MYDDFEYEPKYPEVEEIIEEAQNKFADYLEYLYKEKYAFLEDRAEELNERECELRQKEINVSNRETALEKTEKDLYENFKNEWFLSLGLDWKLNDTAYTYVITPPKHVICPTCKGKKKVNVTIDDSGEKREITCPTCTGYGEIGEKYKEYLIYKRKVTQICYGVCASINQYNNKVSVTKYTEESNTIFKTYLELDDGFRYSPENVFHSKEECEKAAREEIKKKNETLISG